MTRDEFLAIKKLPFYKGKIVSGSMVPVIKIGETITIEVAAQDLKRFDIIVFFYQDELVCHYLWNWNRIIPKPLFQTRNMQGQKDYPVSWDDFLGKVVSHRLSFWEKLKILFR